MFSNASYAGLRRGLTLAVLLLALPWATAQTAQTGAAIDPLAAHGSHADGRPAGTTAGHPASRARQPDADAAGPAAPMPSYRSVFDDYRGFDEQPVSPWPQANELVGRRGGWRAYAREAQQDHHHGDAR